MNSRRTFHILAVALLVIAGAVAIGMGAYNAGVAHGLAENGRFAAAPGGVPYPYPYMWRPWGFGFGFFPLFFILFWFVVIRGLFWRGPWGGWPHRYGGRVPPAFDEWHRRAHAQQPPPAGSHGL